MEETSKKVRHTPAPWRVHYDEDEDKYSVFRPDRSIGTVFIAQEIYQGTDSGKADAYLIAAAPSLLETLVEVNNRYASLMTEKMQKKITNAIKLAKGEIKTELI